MTDLFEICRKIAAGDLDEDLEMILSAIVIRRSKMADGEVPTIAAIFHRPKVGQSGRLKSVTPKYLIGAPITVVKVNRTRAVITLDPAWLDANPRAKSRWGGRVTAPFDILDLDA